MAHHTSRRTLISLAAATSCALLASPVAAQQSPGASAPAATAASAPTAGAADSAQVVEISGIRASLGQAVELKREAIGVRDSIVAEDIGKFPDANIAEALGKLPGVEVIRDQSSNEGQSVRLRGLGVNQTLTTLNGAAIRTTSTTKIGLGLREFSYDLFPSELLGRADVYKTPMAELQEGGIGGVVDLQTPRPFNRKGLVGRYTLSAAQNSNDGNTNPRGSLFLSNTWGKFGALVSVGLSKANNGNAGSMNSTGQYVATGLNYANQNRVLWNTTTPTGAGGLTIAQLESGMLPRLIRIFGQENLRERGGINTSFQYKDDRWNVSLDSLYAKMTDDTKDYFVHWSVSDSTGAGRALIPVAVSLDANNNLQGQIGNMVQNTFSRTYLNESKFGYNALNATYQATDKLRLKGQLAVAKDDAWRNTTLISANGDTSAALRQTLTVNFSDPLRPLVSSNRSLLDRTNQNNFSYSGSYVEEKDEQKVASIAAEYDWDLGGIEGRLKSGLSRSESSKAVQTLNAPNVLNNYLIPGLNKTYAAATAAERAAFMQGIMTPNNIPALARNAGQGYPTEFLVADRDFVLGTLGALDANKASPVLAPSSYKNTETVNAFYVQTDLETQLLSRRLRANLGVRVAQTSVDTDTVRQATAGNWVPVRLEGSYTDTLPSVSFAYDVLKNVVWRGSWGKTLTPNRVSDISQALRLGNASQFVVTAGNPGLEPERATGRDTAVEWYPTKTSVVALGYFERRVSGFGQNETIQVPFNELGLDIALWQPAQQAELLANPARPIDVRRRVNSPGSYEIKGYEFAYSQAFRFLPYPFNGLGGTLSATRVDSAGISRVIGGQSFNLPDLPPKSLAVTAYYEQGPFSARLSYNHKDEFADTFTTDMNPVGFNKWNSERSYIDVTVGYKILKSLELRLDLINLTKTKTYTYFKRYVDVGQGSATGPTVNYGDDKSRVENGFQAGRTVQLTLRGSF